MPRTTTILTEGEKKYKKQWVLNGIDISIEEPQIAALVGPNGSGKTTLLNCMTNLLPFDEGDVQLLGKKHTDPTIFYDASYLQDNRILYEHLTGLDHLKFICKVQKIPLSRIKEVTDRVGMSGYVKKRVRNYSLGMKQHLLLAMVIINDPKLLLLDEPLNGLDPTSAVSVRNILLELHDEGTTILLSSHNLDEIDRVTNTIYFLKGGRLLKESLADVASNQYFVTVSNLPCAQTVLHEAGVTFDTTDKGEVTFEESDLHLQSFIDLMNGHNISLENIHNEMVGAEKRYQQLFKGVDHHETVSL
ncbi:sn-glycerol-3-phosphate import ATP-binding protein UgpC [Lentibacillus sp. JNUCC-1]|uniref:ABC transporter ATP-binding protein n=1 Tax=Lentibacillus sp. JNUCC-1 TaxID=2654513 RepID=UPI0012E75707|nr:ABC transporter ATP-binding protein [Lentibacillus sp. JNUCC-1]MUV38686.1 sn-glycerol-3-phosphate import ATP-binding protein UgpC [Lentibacillus sp. JNUCC-1]